MLLLMRHHSVIESLVARITLRLPDDLHRRLQDTCRRTGNSLNQTIVAALAQALARSDQAAERNSALMEQLSHIKTALRDITVDIEVSRFPAQFRPEEEVPSREELVALLPTLSPPLSSTILEERRERV